MSRQLPLNAYRPPHNPIFNEYFPNDEILAKFSEPTPDEWEADVVAQGEKGIPRPTNPFLVDTIVDQIFSYLDQRDLLACRAVSRLWRDLASPLVYAKSRAILPGPLEDEASQTFLDTMMAAGVEGLPMSAVTYPMSHYGSQTARIFNERGVFLSELTVQAFPNDVPAGPVGSTRFVHVLRSLLEANCPNLKELTLSHLEQLSYVKPLVACPAHESHFDFIHQGIEKLTLSFSRNFNLPRNDGQRANFMTFIQQLITRFPNLKSLTTNFKTEQRENVIHFMESLRDSLNCEKIEEFSLQGDGMNSMALDILQSMNFTVLKSLELSLFVYTDAEQVGLNNFLDGVSETLERLAILGDYKRRYTFARRFAGLKGLSLPSLPNLKEFEMKNFNAIRIEGFGFLKMLPNVRNLVLTDMDPPVEDLTICRHMNVLGDVACLNAECGAFLEAGTTFPNVKVLGFHAMIIPNYESLRNFEKVLDMFPNLEELEINVSFVHRNLQTVSLLMTLAKRGINLKKVRVNFHQCNELRNEMVMNQFLQGLQAFLYEFKELRNLELVLTDMPAQARIMLPFVVLERMLGFGERFKLNYLHLEGFMIGLIKHETTFCKLLMDAKLCQWSVRERERSGK